MQERITIGQAAAAAGCKVQTLRYYEQIGLLPHPLRSEGNQRLYRRADVDRLLFIRHARDLGFSLQAVRDLLSLVDQPDQACDAADAIAKTQLVEVEQRIDRLLALKAALEGMIRQCSGGKISDCRVIQALCDEVGRGEVSPRDARR